jgi:hypothetical protein
VKDPGNGADRETMWAQHVEGDIYKLDNVPLLAFGVALNDVLVATPSTLHRWPVFREVLEHSGHSTSRILVPRDWDLQPAEAAWKSLEELGCGREKSSDYHRAVTVPPEADRATLDKILDDGVSGHVWHVEDGYIHPLPETSATG